MKFSESSDYMRYGRSLARDDIDSAKQAIQACLDTPAFQADSGQYAHLHQIMGGLCFKAGEETEALHYHQQAEEIDQQSLIVKYLFAKFLFENLGDANAALSKCERIIALANERPFEESDEDFSSDWYIEQASQLKTRVKGAANNRRE